MEEIWIAEDPTKTETASSVEMEERC